MRGGDTVMLGSVDRRKQSKPIKSIGEWEGNGGQFGLQSDVIANECLPTTGAGSCPERRARRRSSPDSMPRAQARSPAEGPPAWPWRRMSIHSPCFQSPHWDLRALPMAMWDVYAHLFPGGFGIAKDIKEYMLVSS